VNEIGQRFMQKLKSLPAVNQGPLYCNGNTEHSIPNTRLDSCLKGYVEIQDCGYVSPDVSRGTALKNNIKTTLPSPIQSTSSDDENETEIESLYEEEDEDSGNGSSCEEGEKWPLVTSRLTRSDTNTFSSEYCDQRALCTKTKCKYKHTPKEKETFEARRVARLANDKDFNDSKFRTDLCKVNVLHNLKKCRFAHGLDQLICKICNEIGHKTEICSRAQKDT
jgi:hypothetical protein